MNIVKNTLRNLFSKKKYFWEQQKREMQMDKYEINFIEDAEVDAVLNEKLIKILSGCFDNQPLFKERRYYKEMPGFRWYIEENGQIIAHTAVHEKNILVGDQKIKIGGIAEVCAHPEYRGKGLVKLLLKNVDRWLVGNNYKYAMLFGDKNVYGSSGYFNIDNQIKYVDYETKEVKIEISNCAMVKTLAGEPWLEGLVDLMGPTF